MQLKKMIKIKFDDLDAEGFKKIIDSIVDNLIRTFKSR